MKYMIIPGLMQNKKPITVNMIIITGMGGLP